MYKNSIGIIGGMGSYATLDFFRRVLNAFPAEKEWDRPRIIIDNRCTMPSRVRAILYQENVSELIADLSESRERICTNEKDIYVILACNTCHYFLPYLKNRFPDVKFVDIIESLAMDLTDRNVSKFYLLASEGTIKSQIYKKYFDKYGITIECPDDFEHVRYFIECVKQHKVTKENKILFQNYINSLQEDNIVLGCTELPVLTKDIQYTKTLFDPLKSTILWLKNYME